VRPDAYGQGKGPGVLASCGSPVRAVLPPIVAGVAALLGLLAGPIGTWSSEPFVAGVQVLYLSAVLLLGGLVMAYRRHWTSALAAAVVVGLAGVGYDLLSIPHQDPDGESCTRTGVFPPVGDRLEPVVGAFAALAIAGAVACLAALPFARARGTLLLASALTCAGLAIAYLTGSGCYGL
jgi:hypothetical protein